MRLEQIAEISERLEPLADKQRGMRIEAEDWNALVDALRGILAIDRAQERGVEDILVQRFAPADHGHLGQVGLEWLDPELQAQVSGGGESVSVRSAFAELDKKVSALGDQVGNLTSRVEQQRKTTDSASVDLLDASSSLRAFEKRFTGLESLATSVGALNSDVGGLRTRFKEVLDLRGSLTDPAGNPIDVAKLRDDLKALESLRQNLQGVDGSLLRVRDIEIRIRDLEDSVGLGDGSGLDERFAELASGVESRLTASVTERIGALGDELRSSSATSLEALSAELRTRIDDETASIRAMVDEQVSEAEARVSGWAASQIDAAAQTVQEAVLQSARAEIDARLASLPSQIDSAVSAARVETETALRVALQNSVDSRVGEQVGAAEQRLKADVARIESDLGRARDDLTSEVTNLFEMERENLAAELNGRLDQAIATVRTDLVAFLTEQVGAAVDSRLGTLDERIATSVNASLANLDARIDGSVAARLKNLPEDIQSQVRSQIDALDIPQSLANLDAGLTKRFRTDLTKTEDSLRASQADAINEAIALLRQEIARSQAASVERSIAAAQAMIDQLRKELGLRTGSVDSGVSPVERPSDVSTAIAGSSTKAKRKRSK